ncbi:MAG: hypothetical protein JWO80_3919, partial [Bryobacterales bacterium]|nr:hypothetical protein [Bryobacterales bacterium]
AHLTLLMPAGAGFDADHQQAEMIDYAGLAGQIAAAFHNGGVAVKWSKAAASPLTAAQILML